jgi:pentatricopeptide repeat protein
MIKSESNDDTSIANSKHPGSVMSFQSSLASKSNTSPSKSKLSNGKSTMSSKSSVGSVSKRTKSSRHTDEDSSQASGHSNRINDKSDEFLRHEEIYRQFRIAVKQTDDYVKKITEKSEQRIQERSIGYQVQTKIDADIHQSSKIKHLSQEKYVFEVDKAMEDRAQLKASRQYHMAHIHRLLPEWCKVVEEILQLVRGYGHNNKLQWRSKAKTLAKRCLELMEFDPCAEDSIVRMRRLHLTINAHKAQQVITLLLGIKNDYIVSLEGESDLGRHNAELKKIEKQLKAQPVPLTRKEWSSDLDSTLRMSSAMQKSSLLSTGLALAEESTKGWDTAAAMGFGESRFTDADATACVGGVGLEGSVFSVPPSVSDEPDKFLSHKEEPFAVTTLPLIVYPPADVKTPAAAMKLLRKAARNGQLREAWGLFNCLFGEFIVTKNQEKFFKHTLKAAPNLDVIKLLITAFKNSTSFSYVDVTNIFLAMTHLHIEPDAHLYNILIRACERRGAWRKALYYVREMQDKYDLVPNTNTYATLMDCCRHVAEDPAAIFETLRNEGFPRKYVPFSYTLCDLYERN